MSQFKFQIHGIEDHKLSRNGVHGSPAMPGPRKAPLGRDVSLVASLAALCPSLHAARSPLLLFFFYKIKKLHKLKILTEEHG
jgi:hypothetical protein